MHILVYTSCVHSCARRRTEEEANQNESQLVAEVESEEVMEREITLTEEETQSTALKPQKCGTENVAMLNKAKEPTEGMVVRGLTCEQVLLQYIRSAQSGHTVAAGEWNMITEGITFRKAT